MNEYDGIEPFTIMSSMGGELEQSHEVPATVFFEKLPGAKLGYYHGPWGYIVLQELRGWGLSLWDSQYYLRCPVTLRGRVNRPITELHTSTKNHFESKWEGMNLPTEREGQGCLSHDPFANNTVIFSVAQHYRTDDFHFEPEHLVPYAETYPKVYKLLNDAARKKSARLDRLFELDAALKVILYGIRHPTCAPGMRDRYFQLKAEEFLIGALDRMDPQLKADGSFKLTRNLRAKAEDLELLLRARYTEHFTLKEMSKLVAVNVKDMRMAFKKRYEMTVFQYLKRIRLERAKELLLTQPESDLLGIALSAGFYDASYLIHAFKEAYDITPAAYRRQYGQK